MQPTPPQHLDQPTAINVDDLAKEKVEEIEASLGDGLSTTLKLSDFSTWFSILKQIITSADLHRTNNDRENKTQKENQNGKTETGDSIYADFSDDNEHFTAQVDLSEQFATNSVKWTIRVKAFKIVHRLVQLVIETKNDTNQAGTNSVVRPTQVLIKHLPDLVRLSFVAATSPYDELKIQGFDMLRVLIERFASHEEPEFPGHSILEQYKMQFLSAVKPAFNLDAPPYITAIASQICSLWICQGLEKNLADIKRTYQLMLLSIEKLEGQSFNQHSKLYTESELEQERVDILGAWAQLYISAMESDLPQQHGKISRLTKPECSNLNSLVQCRVETLVDKWWEAMKDYALLIMPAPKVLGTSHDNDNVYTREVALKLFSPTWPKLVLALSIWLCNDENKKGDKTKYCKFLCGIVMKELCRCLINVESKHKLALPQSTILALRSTNLLLSSKPMQSVFLIDLAMAQEFYRTLYHLTVSHARDPNRLLLRQTLDQLYGLVVSKIEQDEKNVHYGIAKLISSLMSTMKDIENASREKSSIEIDVFRNHLSIRLRNLTTLIKSSPVTALNEAPLQVALIAVFQELLRFQQEPTVSVTSADQLKELLLALPGESLRVHLLDELFPELCDRVGELVRQLFSCDRYSDVDKVHLAQVDGLLKSMRLMLDTVSQKSRQGKMESYIHCTIDPVKSCDSSSQNPDSWISTDARKRRELLDFIVNQVVALRELYPDVELTPAAQQMLDFANQLQQSIRTKLEPKRQKQQGASKPTSTRPQVAKIALKADFSNFYSKKP